MSVDVDARRKTAGGLAHTVGTLENAEKLAVDTQKSWKARKVCGGLWSLSR